MARAVRAGRDVGRRVATLPTRSGLPRTFWTRVLAAPHRLLMLDYDGTLAPFRIVPAEAAPVPESMERLRAIATGGVTTAAIVSGRRLEDLETLVGDLPVRLVGEHGWERREPGGEVVRHAPTPGATRALDRGEQAARAHGGEGRIERKRFSVVFHTRGLPADRAHALERDVLAAWAEQAAASVVHATRINGGVELRAVGRDKGTAVRELVAQARPGAYPVFVGDDLTDEDAFDVVRYEGYGIRVGSPGRSTRAASRLADCAAVSVFLDDWLRLTTGDD